MPEFFAFRRLQNVESNEEETPAEEALRVMRRLHQLAKEIRGALSQNNLDLVCKASALLVPTLQQWRERQPQLNVSAGEAAQIALDTRSLLNECEILLTQAMARVTEDMGRVRKGRGLIANLRARGTQPTGGRRLDTYR